MTDTQQRIDFDFAERRNMLGWAVLPKVAGVSAATLKLVLHRIDDRGRGRAAFISVDTLATECGLTARQIKRAIAALRDLSLITVDLRKSSVGVVCNHYSIVWSELALLCPDRRPRPTTAEPSGPAQAAEPPPTASRCSFFNGRIRYSAASEGPEGAPRKTPPTDGTYGATDGTYGATDGTYGATDGTYKADRWDTGVPLTSYNHLRTTSNQEAATIGCDNRTSATPAKPKREGEGDFALSVVRLEAEGVYPYKARQLAQAFAYEAIAEAVDVYRANRSRFTSPGAIATKLESGVWPAAGVVGAEGRAELERKIAENKRRQAAALRRSLEAAGVDSS